MAATLYGFGAALLSGVQRVLPGGDRRDIERLTDDLERIEQTLGCLREGSIVRKRSAGTCLSSPPKRTQLARTDWAAKPGSTPLDEQPLPADEEATEATNASRLGCSSDDRQHSAGFPQSSTPSPSAGEPSHLDMAHPELLPGDLSAARQPTLARMATPHEQPPAHAAVQDQGDAAPALASASGDLNRINSAAEPQRGDVISQDPRLSTAAGFFTKYDMDLASQNQQDGRKVQQDSSGISHALSLSAPPPTEQVTGTSSQVQHDGFQDKDASPSPVACPHDGVQDCQQQASFQSTGPLQCSTSDSFVNKEVWLDEDLWELSEERSHAVQPTPDDNGGQSLDHDHDTADAARSPSPLCGLPHLSAAAIHSQAAAHVAAAPQPAVEAHASHHAFPTVAMSPLEVIARYGSEDALPTPPALPTLSGSPDPHEGNSTGDRLRRDDEEAHVSAGSDSFEEGNARFLKFLTLPKLLDGEHSPTAMMQAAATAKAAAVCAIPESEAEEADQAADQEAPAAVAGVTASAVTQPAEDVPAMLAAEGFDRAAQSPKAVWSSYGETAFAEPTAAPAIEERMDGAEEDNLGAIPDLQPSAEPKASQERMEDAGEPPRPAPHAAARTPSMMLSEPDGNPEPEARTIVTSGRSACPDPLLLYFPQARLLTPGWKARWDHGQGPHLESDEISESHISRARAFETAPDPQQQQQQQKLQQQPSASDDDADLLCSRARAFRAAPPARHRPFCLDDSDSGSDHGEPEYCPGSPIQQPQPELDLQGAAEKALDDAMSPCTDKTSDHAKPADKGCVASTPEVPPRFSMSPGRLQGKDSTIGSPTGIRGMKRLCPGAGSPPRAKRVSFSDAATTKPFDSQAPEKVPLAAAEGEEEASLVSIIERAKALTRPVRDASQNSPGREAGHIRTCNPFQVTASQPPLAWAVKSDEEVSWGPLPKPQCWWMREGVSDEGLPGPSMPPCSHGSGPRPLTTNPWIDLEEEEEPPSAGPAVANPEASVSPVKEPKCTAIADVSMYGTDADDHASPSKASQGLCMGVTAKAAASIEAVTAGLVATRDTRPDSPAVSALDKADRTVEGSISTAATEIDDTAPSQFHLSGSSGGAVQLPAAADFSSKPQPAGSGGVDDLSAVFRAALHSAAAGPVHMSCDGGFHFSLETGAVPCDRTLHCAPASCLPSRDSDHKPCSPVPEPRSPDDPCVPEMDCAEDTGPMPEVPPAEHELQPASASDSDGAATAVPLNQATSERTDPALNTETPAEIEGAEPMATLGVGSAAPTDRSVALQRQVEEPRLAANAPLDQQVQQPASTDCCRGAHHKGPISLGEVLAELRAGKALLRKCQGYTATPSPLSTLQLAADIHKPQEAEIVGLDTPGKRQEEPMPPVREDSGFTSPGSASSDGDEDGDNAVGITGDDGHVSSGAVPSQHDRDAPEGVMTMAGELAAEDVAAESIPCSQYRLQLAHARHVLEEAQDKQPLEGLPQGLAVCAADLSTEGDAKEIAKPAPSSRRDPSVEALAKASPEPETDAQMGNAPAETRASGPMDVAPIGGAPMDTEPHAEDGIESCIRPAETKGWGPIDKQTWDAMDPEDAQHWIAREQLVLSEKAAAAAAAAADKDRRDESSKGAEFLMVRGRQGCAAEAPAAAAAASYPLEQQEASAAAAAFASPQHPATACAAAAAAHPTDLAVGASTPKALQQGSAAAAAASAGQSGGDVVNPSPADERQGEASEADDEIATPAGTAIAELARAEDTPLAPESTQVLVENPAKCDVAKSVGPPCDGQPIETEGPGTSVSTAAAAAAATVAAMDTAAKGLSVTDPIIHDPMPVVGEDGAMTEPLLGADTIMIQSAKGSPMASEESEDELAGRTSMEGPSLPAAAAVPAPAIVQSEVIALDSSDDEDCQILSPRDGCGNSGQMQAAHAGPAQVEASWQLLQRRLQYQEMMGSGV